MKTIVGDAALFPSHRWHTPHCAAVTVVPDADAVEVSTRGAAADADAVEVSTRGAAADAEGAARPTTAGTTPNTGGQGADARAASIAVAVGVRATRQRYQLLQRLWLI